MPMEKWILLYRGAHLGQGVGVTLAGEYYVGKNRGGGFGLCFDGVFPKGREVIPFCVVMAMSGDFSSENIWLWRHAKRVTKC